MRYFQEYRHKFSDASGVAIDAGKKLLGYIANQKRLSGVDSMVQRISVQDEAGAVWVVEARFDKDIPSVRIFPPNGGDAMCELYVESGLLDLGPSIAGDAGDRFNRGLPAFSEDPARLYFGTDVACVAGQPGLNGAVRLQGQNISSDCLPNIGNGIASRLTDPVKKQAQALLPASCWSGLMQRYVQAVYGGASLDYEANGDLLLVEGVSIGFSTGLIEVDGVHLFVFAGSGPILIAPLRFKSACGEAVYRAWQNASLAADQSKKLLTIALSDAFPGDAVSIGDSGELDIASLYGWQFSAASPEAHVVAFNATQATLKKLAVSVVEGAYVATVTDVETALLAPAAFPCILIGPDGTSTSLCSTDGLTFGESFDHPVHCYYDDDLVVVRYSVETPALAVETQEGWECTSEGHGTPQVGPITWGIDTFPEALNCQVSVQQQAGTRLPPPTHTRFAFSLNKHAIVTGLYAMKGDVSVWSTVRTSDACAAAFPADNGSDEGDYSNPTWFFQGGWTVQLRTMNLGEAFTATMPFFAGNGALDWTYCPNPLLGDSLLVGEATKCSLNGPNFYSYINYDPMDDGWSCDVSPVDMWASIFDRTHHNFDSVREADISCSVPCHYVSAHQFYGELVLGPQNYLAIPRGDCSAMIPVDLQVSGVTLGQNPFADGYTVFSGRACNDPYSGECTGTVTTSCNGYDPTVPGFTHAPHSEAIYEISTASMGFYKSALSQPFPVVVPSWVDGSGVPTTQPFPLGDGSDAAGNWIKDRLEIDWTSLSVSGGLIADPLERTGQFEELVLGTEIPWEATEYPVTCPTWQAIVYAAYTLDPITVDGEDGETTAERMYLTSPTTLLQRGFSYAYRRSLLNARTTWTSALDFGASNNMDRETITGGYSPVSTPSFVGWA